MASPTWREPFHRGVSVHTSRAEAEPLLREALRLAEAEAASREDLRSILYHLGQACAGTGKLEEAEAFLRRAVALAQDDPHARANESALASVLRRRGDLAGARAIYLRGRG